MLFQASASNYRFRDALRHLFTTGNHKHQAELKSYLSERYGGEVRLYSRGRGALAATIQQTTGGSGYVALTLPTCFAVVEAVQSTGCQPLYVDIDPKTFQPDWEGLESALQNPECKVFIVQNTAGIVNDIEKIQDLAKAYEVQLIEDLAHSVGGQYANGQEVGTLGDYTMLAFSSDKVVDAVNGGAAIARTGPSPEQPAKGPKGLQQLRDRLHPLIGCMARFWAVFGLYKVWLAGIYDVLRVAERSADGKAEVNQSLPGWQAKLALRQLKKPQDRLAKQEYYQKHLKLPIIPSANGARVTLLVDDRQKVLRKLRKAGADLQDTWYDYPISPVRLYRQIKFDEAKYPGAMELTEHLINLPTHKLVNQKWIGRIIRIVNQEAKPWK